VLSPDRATLGPPHAPGKEARLLQRADRLGVLLNPQEIIPCHPAGEFIAFTNETLAAGHSLGAVRTVTTCQP
jgi:hypothetical protein